MTPADDFERLDINLVRSTLEHLFEQVVRDKGRVEVTRGDGTDDACVLISKAELESLERAIEIFSNTEGCKEMEKLVTDVALQAEPAISPA
jgi:PHD/YefM family antitoxin component YafN of YafNO toxin-antitoxin module